jgi:peptidoglycan/xylan/chitin deacetylase (PgdA/CDA1 family)
MVRLFPASSRARAALITAPPPPPEPVAPAPSFATVSFDVSNLWWQLRRCGYRGGYERRPSYLDVFTPVALEALDRAGVKATFFVVGVDAARRENAVPMAQLTAHGHEVGNHSHEHDPMLHGRTREEITSELVHAEDAIIAATGARPVGFRGPGYEWSPALLEVLADRGYLYSACTVDSHAGPPSDGLDAAAVTGSAADVESSQAPVRFVVDEAPVVPYRWRLPSGRSLLELPATTVPGLQTPLHLGHLLELAGVSDRLMDAYLRSALLAFRAAGREPQLVVRPLDLLGGDQSRKLASLPGMDVPGARKAALFGRVLRAVGQRFEFATMAAHARAVLDRPGLADRSLAPVRHSHATRNTHPA